MISCKVPLFEGKPTTIFLLSALWIQRARLERTAESRDQGILHDLCFCGIAFKKREIIEDNEAIEAAEKLGERMEELGRIMKINDQ